MVIRRWNTVGGTRTETCEALYASKERAIFAVKSEKTSSALTGRVFYAVVETLALKGSRFEVIASEEV